MRLLIAGISAIALVMIIPSSGMIFERETLNPQTELVQHSVAQLTDRQIHKPTVSSLDLFRQVATTRSPDATQPSTQKPLFHPSVKALKSQAFRGNGGGPERALRSASTRPEPGNKGTAVLEVGSLGAFLYAKMQDASQPGLNSPLPSGGVRSAHVHMVST